MDLRISSLKENTINFWNNTPLENPAGSRLFSKAEQLGKELELDRLMDNLQEARSSVRRSSHDKTTKLVAVRSRVQKSIVQLLHSFDCVIDDEMENSFSHVTDEFIQKAFHFDKAITEEAVYQASRNVMIMNTFQMHLGIPVTLTPSVFAYSLLYPYTDNYLDDALISMREKLDANRWLGLRLSGVKQRARNRNERTIDSLVGMIEGEFNRSSYPLVYESLLAIHDAQTRSVSQQNEERELFADDLLDISFEKGGSSVLADGYLVAGILSHQNSEFFFNFGIILQLIDDLQDLEEDVLMNQSTLVGAIANTGDLDQFTNRLLMYLKRVIETSNHDSEKLYRLIERSCRLLILEAVAENHLYYSADYLTLMERQSPVRFDYLRSVKERLRESDSTSKLSRIQMLRAVG